MIAVLVCVENYTAVINWQDFFKASLHVGIPKLQISAVFFLPVFVQIDNGVQSSVDIEFLVESEVRVNAKVATTFCFVQPATGEIGVGYQALNARQFSRNCNMGAELKALKTAFR